MSLLTTVAARPGPSTTLTRIVSVEGRRYKSVQVKQPGKTTQQAGFLKRNNEQQNRNSKRLPIYKPMPSAQLDHPIFKTVPPPLEVPEFTPKNVAKDTAVGQPFVINAADNDPLKIFGLPRKLWLEFKLLTKPYTVVRQITRDTIQQLRHAKKQPSTENRMVLTGRPGCGKSFLLLQAVENCVRDGWVVVYIPRGIDLVNSTNDYYYDIRTQTYVQPFYSFQTLQRMLKVNSKALAQLTLKEELVLEKRTLKAGTKLTQVIEAIMAEKARSIAQAPLVLDAVMRSLEAQSDYPVLLAVDDIQALYGKTLYRDPQFVPIHSYHLSLPRLIMEYASGQRVFPKGAFMGAISRSQSSWPVSTELRDAIDFNPMDMRPVSPYDKRNKTMLSYGAGLKNLEVPEQLTLDEAAGIFEIWKGQGVFGRNKYFYDEAFLGKYTESGGNARDFVRNGIVGTLDA
ncbi:hypothetical protein D9619_006611 [Psilocybe cf. subviscida]|uniref:Small ribosomal subunit protein mS29 n=1 Tax=Psilocybe cf. subviscida TaxID=2480587 RepID=A0A8H5B4I4_9AGAR|nr:hypothetical protein D9619_006611 [Psilocybe cf. subviscida]